MTWSCGAIDHAVTGYPALKYDSEQSKFFKHHYKSGFNNKGIMERE